MDRNKVEDVVNEYRNSLNGIYCPVCNKLLALVDGKFNVRCSCDGVVIFGDTKIKEWYIF